jgi:DNA-3-methyladenine glycosylase II
VQEAVKIGLGLKTRPTAKEMAPIAEPWRPMRGAAAHLWWAYYRAIKNREGVVAGTQNTNAVSNKVLVVKRSSERAKITATQPPRSKK